MNEKMIEAIIQLVRDGGAAAIWITVLWLGLEFARTVLWIGTLLVFIYKGASLIKNATDKFWENERRTATESKS